MLHDPEADSKLAKLHRRDGGKAGPAATEKFKKQCSSECSRSSRSTERKWVKDSGQIKKH